MLQTRERKKRLLQNTDEDNEVRVVAPSHIDGAPSPT
jgi:hypothetical protein